MSNSKHPFGSTDLPSNWRNTLGCERGYTLIEFIVVLVVMSFVGGAVASLYLFSAKWVTNWQYSLEVENNAHLLMNQISTDLRYADQLITYSDSLWIIENRRDEDIQYSILDSSIYRNQLRILRHGIEVASFSMQENNMPQLNLEYEYSPDSRLVSVHFSLKANQTLIALRSRIGMRQSTPWPIVSSPADTSGNH